MDSEARRQRYSFCIVDFENLQQARKLQDFASRTAQSNQDEPGADIARSFEDLPPKTPRPSYQCTLPRSEFNTTRDLRLSRTSCSRAFRTSGEFARSMSPDMSKIVALSTRRMEICITLRSSRPGMARVKSFPDGKYFTNLSASWYVLPACNRPYPSLRRMKCNPNPPGRSLSGLCSRSLDLIYRRSLGRKARISSPFFAPPFRPLSQAVGSTDSIG